jgi:arabinan endo-1,5-alpha-L-arabinosidase
MAINSKNIPRDDLYNAEILDDEKRWTTNNVHDPGSFKDADTYYVFSTDAQNGGTFRGGVQVRKSKDLMNWEWVGRAFPDVPEEAKAWTGAKGLWAPDVEKFGDTYYLYYCASQFGKNQSFIGVATSQNIEGPWEDQGEVFKTKQGDGPNAIDPNITFDKNGEPWMVYGSFFGGLFVSKIDPNTGKLLEYGEGKLIAKRHISVEGAIEGPYIIYNKEFDYYYLFVSYDSLFTQYNIRVARSKNIEGPYLDHNGNEMTNTTLPPNDVGMKVLGGYKFGDHEGWVCPGHNSILKDGENYFIIHHARGERDKRWHYLHTRKIVWTRDGWPLVSPERYAGEEEASVALETVIGDWQLILMDKDNNVQVHSNEIKMTADVISKLGSNEFQLLYGKNIIEGIIMPGWDWEEWHETLVFMGKNNKGEVFVGKKLKI